MIKRLIGLVFLSMFPSFAPASSFGGETNFTAIPIEADLTVHCRGFPESDIVRVICRDMILDPFEMAYFYAEKDVNADEAVLVSQRADGERVEKRLPYDSTQGRTSQRVNLWIETLFQTALLDIGVNPISYELRSGDEVKGQGQFDVTVSRGEKAICPRGQEFSQQIRDCQFPENACRRYFSRNNWCL